MLLALVFAAAPQTFVDIVDQRLAGTALHVVDWWADDLDGDKIPEAIAQVCDARRGFFIVRHGSDILEAPMEIDGRNRCPDVATKPAWHVRRAGTIGQPIDVHHGYVTREYAIRDHQLVMVREGSHGFDVTSSGARVDYDDASDFDKLTWTERHAGKAARGPLVLATEHVHRATPIVGKTTIAATQSNDDLTLHIHADRALAVRSCLSDSEPDSCTVVKLAKGDHELAIATAEIVVSAARTTYRVHVARVALDQSYPPPPRPW